MQNARTISKLLESDKRVYIYLRNKAVCKLFLQNAQNEGFLFSDGKKPTSKKYCDIMVINRDFAISYVTLIGHRNFNSESCDTKRIDYQKYLNLWDNYTYTKS